MPTIDDLRTVLDQRAQLCADDQVFALVRTQEPTRPGRRRVMAPALVAAAVAAVIAGALTIAGAFTQRHDDVPSAGMPAYPPHQIRWQFSIHPVPGWTVSRADSIWLTDPTGTAGGWQQGAIIVPAKGEHPRLVYSYQPTGVEPFPGSGVTKYLAKAQQVTINGRSALFVPGSAVDTTGFSPAELNRPWDVVASSGDWQPQLVWRNSDGSWNALSGTAGFNPRTYNFDNAVAKRVMVRVAQAVSITDAGPPATMPFVVNLDDPFRPALVSTVRGVACANWTTIHAPVGDQNPAVTVCRAPNGNLGDPAVPHQDAISRGLGDGTTLVVWADPTALSAADRNALLDKADVSPRFADPSTWLPIR